MHKLFPVTYISRQDLVDAGLVEKDIARQIKDETMEKIARNLEAEYEAGSLGEDLAAVYKQVQKQINKYEK